MHAEEPAKPATAREALRRAARAIDRARGPLHRDDGAEALAIWRASSTGAGPSSIDSSRTAAAS